MKKMYLYFKNTISPEQYESEFNSLVPLYSEKG